MAGGIAKHPMYQTWSGMRTRCYNPKFKQFADYGGRGIGVCERWRTSFMAFVEDMGERPAGGTLDRIDPNGDYSPENCRWVTIQEQQFNRRDTVTVMIEGRAYRPADLAAQSGRHRQTIIKRANKGWPLDRVLSPKHNVNPKSLAAAWKASSDKAAGRNACRRGHEYTSETLYVPPSGGSRRCKVCDRAARLKREGRDV